MDDAPVDEVEVARGTNRLYVDDDQAEFLEDAFTEIDQQFERLKRDFEARQKQLHAEKMGIVKTARAFLGIPDDWELNEADDGEGFYFEDPDADAVQDDEDDGKSFESDDDNN